MSGAPSFARLSGSDSAELASAAPSTSNPNTIGHPVVRNPAQLRLHPALDDLGGIGIEELNAAARLKNQSLPEPIFITPNGTILAGIGTWRLALFEEKQEVQCIEYQVADDDVLSFMLTHHRPRHGWNAFVRIRLARAQKSDFQRKAHANMRAGGECKGLTNLLKADRINVCREIPKLAGTGTTNVGKVETIMRKAHPSIIAALQNGSLRIHPAWSWCKLSKLEQRDEFARYEEKRTERKILKEFSPGHASASHQLSEVLDALQRVEARNPGSIITRKSRSKRTVITLGQDSLAELDTQKEIDCHA